VEQVREELVHQQTVFRVNGMVNGLVIQAGALVAPSELIGGGFDCADDAIGGGFGHWRESSGNKWVLVFLRITWIALDPCPSPAPASRKSPSQRTGAHFYPRNASTHTPTHPDILGVRSSATVASGLRYRSYRSGP
jgi:hypothetical protein